MLLIPEATVTNNCPATCPHKAELAKFEFDVGSSSKAAELVREPVSPQMVIIDAAAMSHPLCIVTVIKFEAYVNGLPWPIDLRTMVG